MDEAKFVLKCFVFAALVLVLSQLKTKTGTIETDIQAALVNSKTADFVNKTAAGGVKAVRAFISYAEEAYNKDISQETKRELENKKAALQEAAIKKIESLNQQVEKTSDKKVSSEALSESEELIEEIE